MDPEYKKLEITMNAPGTGYKLPAMEPSYFSKVVQKVQLNSYIDDNKE